MKVWDFDGVDIESSDMIRPKHVLFTPSSVGRIAWRPTNSMQIAVTSWDKGDVSIWNVSSSHVPACILDGHAEGCTGVAWLDTQITNVLEKKKDLSKSEKKKARNQTKGGQKELLSLNLHQHLLTVGRDSMVNVHDVRNAYFPRVHMSSGCIAISSSGHLAWHRGKIYRSDPLGLYVGIGTNETVFYSGWYKDQPSRFGMDFQKLAIDAATASDDIEKDNEPKDRQKESITSASTLTSPLPSSNKSKNVSKITKKDKDKNKEDTLEDTQKDGQNLKRSSAMDLNFTQLSEDIELDHEKLRTLSELGIFAAFDPKKGDLLTKFHEKRSKDLSQRAMEESNVSALEPKQNYEKSEMMRSSNTGDLKTISGANIRDGLGDGDEEIKEEKGEKDDISASQQASSVPMTKQQKKRARMKKQKEKRKLEENDPESIDITDSKEKEAKDKEEVVVDNENKDEVKSGSKVKDKDKDRDRDKSNIADVFLKKKMMDDEFDLTGIITMGKVKISGFETARDIVETALERGAEAGPFDPAIVKLLAQNYRIGGKWEEKVFNTTVAYTSSSSVTTSPEMITDVGEFASTEFILDVCRHNKEIAIEAGLDGHALLWQSLKIIIPTLTQEENGKDLEHGSLTFARELLASILSELLDGGDCQHFVICCEMLYNGGILKHQGSEDLLKEKEGDKAEYAPSYMSGPRATEGGESTTTSGDSSDSSKSGAEVLSSMLTSGIPSIRQKEAYYGYLSLLSRLRLFSHANVIVNRSLDSALQEMSRIGVIHRHSCSSCGRELEQEHGNFCRKCHRTVGLCGICNKPVRGLFVWCPVCSHGGHATCVQNWFCVHKECPTGCGHNCIFEIQDQNPNQNRVQSPIHTEANMNVNGLNGYGKVENYSSRSIIQPKRPEQWMSASA